PKLKIVENVSSQTDLRICFRAVPERAPERPAMDMLMRVIDDGMSTRLYHRICDSQGLCYDVSAGFDGYEDDGVLDFAAGVQHFRATQVTTEILALMKELATVGPTEEEMQKGRQRYGWDLTSLRDSPDDLAGFFAGGYLFNRFETPEERLQKTSAVTREQVRDVARLISDPSRLNVTAVGLLENDEDKRLMEAVKTFSY
ncbi:MAG: insulinase family protein, partial [Polyangiaceae bacterium]